MWCTTECWSCEDRTCEYYIDKTKLYFEKKQLEQRIKNAIEYIEQESWYCNKDGEEEIARIPVEELLKILKGED